MQIDVPATENHPLEAQIPGKLACQDLKNATARGDDALRHNEMPDLTYETRHGRRASAQRHTMEAMRANSDSALTERHKSQ